MLLTFFIHLPMKMEPIRSSETSAIKTQTPGNCPKRNILQLKHGVSLKTRKAKFYSYSVSALPKQSCDSLGNLRIKILISFSTAAHSDKFVCNYQYQVSSIRIQGAGSSLLFSSFHIISYSVSVRNYTLCLYLVARLRMSGGIPSHRLYKHMASTGTLPLHLPALNYCVVNIYGE